MKDVLELLKKVRTVEIVAKRTVDELFAGLYRSAFRGRGMEFSEVREYEPGDDIRSIDWNVTARTGHPFIKRYTEERELTVMFLVDVSASGVFGSDRSKMETAVELAATLMFSAMKNNDKIGLITFGGDVEQYFRPRKGRGNVLHLVRQLLACKPGARESNLNKALDYLNRVQKRHAVVFILSDFLIPDLVGLTSDAMKHVTRHAPEHAHDERSQRAHARTLFPGTMPSYLLFGPERRARHRRIALSATQKAFLIATRRHDVVALMVRDHRESDFPDVGLLALEDAETSETLWVDTSGERVRQWISRRMDAVRERLCETLRRAHVEYIPIDTRQDYIRELRDFFKKRSK
ncbi:MAG TPA: DUF58 domain-containing protein [Planctomycetaceae bacterium]|nr:DUF58 domain-containing protein [Planctomycetaceae bacterium]